MTYLTLLSLSLSSFQLIEVLIVQLLTSNLSSHFQEAFILSPDGRPAVRLQKLHIDP